MMRMAGEHEKGAGRDFFGRMGAAGPLASTVVWVAAVAAFIWLMGFINSFVYIPAIAQFRDFLFSNIAYIGAVLLFFNYSSYVSGISKKAYVVLFPLAIAIGGHLALGLLATGLRLAGPGTGIGGISQAGSYMLDNVYTVALALVVISYAGVVGKAYMEGSLGGSARTAPGESGGLEKEREELRKMMKAAEKRYFQRKISKEAFEKMSEQYQQRLAELDVRLGEEEE